MNLVSTRKIYIYHPVSLGVPPKIEGKRCLTVETRDGIDIFEYCDDSEPEELVMINKVFFKQ